MYILAMSLDMLVRGTKFLRPYKGNGEKKNLKFLKEENEIEIKLNLPSTTRLRKLLEVQ